MVTYTFDELEMIQKSAKNILSYALEYDKNTLPRCFEFIRVIINNIDICKDDEYKSANELSILIRQDWGSCMEIHTGLPEYHFDEKNYERRCELNLKFTKMMVDLDQMISKC